MAGVSLKKLSCPNCGAPLQVGAADTLVECKYCHQPIEVQRSAPPRSGPTGPNVVYVPEKGVDFGWWPLLIMFGGMALVAVLVFAGIQLFGFGAPTPRRPTPTSVPVARLGEHLQWHAQGPVHPAHVTDDAVEDVVGLYRLLEDDATMQVFLGAFDGATRARVWSAGPFADLSDTQHLHTARSGNRVLVSDEKATVHLLDLATGKALATARLADRAVQLCGAPSGPARFYAELVDETGVFVSADGKLEPGPAPDFCPLRKAISVGDACRMLPLFGGPVLPCLPKDEAPAVKGLDPEWALGDAHDAVLVGARTPGTRVPMATGYAPATRTVRWTRAIAPGDPLAAKAGPPATVALEGGVLYAYQEQNKGLANLVAIDVRTGETLWQAPVPNSDQGIGVQRITVSDERLYLPHWTWLEILDRKSGQHLGTIGRW